MKKILVLAWTFFQAIVVLGQYVSAPVTGLNPNWSWYDNSADAIGTVSSLGNDPAVVGAGLLGFSSGGTVCASDSSADAAEQVGVYAYVSGDGQNLDVWENELVNGFLVSYMLYWSGLPFSEIPVPDPNATALGQIPADSPLFYNGGGGGENNMTNTVSGVITGAVGSFTTGFDAVLGTALVALGCVIVYGLVKRWFAGRRSGA